MSDDPQVLAYELRPAINAFVRALREHISHDQFIVFRDAFRWKRDNGSLEDIAHRGDVINNGYEMFSIEEIAALLNAKIVWDYNHVAVLEARP